MKDKFNLTQEQNIFFAKRNIVDSLWKSANLEGIAITFSETQKVYDGGNIDHLRIDEIVTINNLKHAWQFILNTLDTELDFKYLCSINALVGSNIIETAGEMRYGDVRIGGTNWKPDLPNKEVIEKDLEEIKKIDNVTERAITIMCYTMRKQIFWDGNKRTAMLFANGEMIKNGKGVISIPIELKEKFGELLTKYYETNNMEELKEFIYENCIDGIKF